MLGHIGPHPRRYFMIDSPSFCMIAIEWSARPRVFEISGERFSVQLTYTPLKSLKSHCDSEQSCSSVWRSTDPPSNKAPQANDRRAYAFANRLATETSPKLEARRSHQAPLDSGHSLGRPLGRAISSSVRAPAKS